MGFVAGWRNDSRIEAVFLHSQAKLSAIARQLNQRPRKTFLHQTPAEKFAECVAAIS